jgi:myosin heavy subunit
MLAIKEMQNLKLGVAVLILQSAIRTYNTRKYYLQMKKACILAQNRWRGIKARRELIELKMEARKLSNVMAQKNVLEKKVEELQWKLTAESRSRQRLEEKYRIQEESLQG